MLKSAKPPNLLDRSLPARTIIWTLAWPTILEQFLQVTVTYVDTAMVGQWMDERICHWLRCADGTQSWQRQNRSGSSYHPTGNPILSFWNIPDIHLSYHCKAASLLDRSRGISKTISATILSLHRIGVFSKPAYDSHQPSVETLEPRSISMA